MPPNVQEYLRASDGVGEAVRAIVVVEREVGSIEINVDSVLNWPSKFIATSGMIDPATGTFDPETVTVFYGHINGTYIEIDEYAPGYFDNGNQANEVIVLKPTTPWADGVSKAIEDVNTEVENIVTDFEKMAFLAAHPIGSTYWNEVNDVDPGTTYGGTWEYLEGVVLGGKSTSGPFNVAAGTVIGADTHTLTVAQIPGHGHVQRASFAGQGIRDLSSDSSGSSGSPKYFTAASQGGSSNNSLSTANTGGGGSHPIVQRTLVGYLWKRTA